MYEITNINVCMDLIANAEFLSCHFVVCVPIHAFKWR